MPRNFHGAASRYRADIDGLRAVAVSAVLLFHAFRAWLPGGFIGVDIFFVISGFLITGIIRRQLEDGTFSFAEFYANRIKRLFPALLVMLSALLIFGWFALLLDEFALLGKHVTAGLLFVQNIALWREAGYFDAASDSKPLLHLWSLGVEEQFYLLFPLLLWAAIGLYRLKPVRLFATLTLVSFAAYLWQTAHDPSAAFFLPQYRLWELTAGALIGSISTASLRADIRETMGAIGVILIAVCACLFTANSDGWLMALPVIGAALAIAAGPTAWVNRRILSHPLAIAIGVISYPLYIWHWPILTMLRVFSVSDPSRASRALAVLASVVLAWLTYRFIERPLRTTSNPRRVRGLTAAALVMTTIALAVFLDDGVIRRFPPAARPLVSYRYNPNLPFRSGTCFYEPRPTTTFTATTFAPGCLATDADKPTMLLWGDSFAAALYSGLKTTFAEANVVQLTEAACPPILGSNTPLFSDCQAMNDFVIRVIGRQRPDVVVLAARWLGFDWKSLSNTLVAIQRAGVERTVIVGSPPWWGKPLPHVIGRAVLGGDAEAPPTRILAPDFEPQRRFDDELRAFALSHGAGYISPLSLLCEADGQCLAVDIKAQQFEPTAYDDQHLTEAGSRLLGQRIRQADAQVSSAILITRPPAPAGRPIPPIVDTATEESQFPVTPSHRAGTQARRNTGGAHAPQRAPAGTHE